MKMEIRVWAPIAATALLLVAILATMAIVVNKQATIDRALVQQQHAIRAELGSHAALLKRVLSDEAKVCLAAKASGDQKIVTILCPGGKP